MVRFLKVTQDPDVALLTVTWAADREHFSLLHHSLNRSPLAQVPHHVVVQHEDLEGFFRFEGARTQLHSSSDLLPPAVEQRRGRARYWQRRLGRGITRTAGSLARHVCWPNWPRYTGWHTQQLTKLAFAATCKVNTVVVMDSDLVVTPHAGLEDFVCPGRIVCHGDQRPVASLRGKVLHWQQTACRVFGDAFAPGASFDGYYDTPFVLHTPTVRAMLAWLEQRYAQPWWLTLVQQPPRRWSEFGFYKQFLRHHQVEPVDWRDTGIFGYLFDAHDVGRLAEQFAELLQNNRSHYITIHSQSSGRQLWTADAYRDRVAQQLDAAYTSVPIASA